MDINSHADHSRASPGPYNSLDKRSSTSPSLSRTLATPGLWHNSRLWGTDSNGPSRSENGSEAAVYPYRRPWTDRVRTVLGANQLNQDNSESIVDTEKATTKTPPLPRIPGTMHSDRAGYKTFAPIHLRQTDLVYTEDAFIHHNSGSPRAVQPARGATHRILQETSESALEQELERQGFGGTSAWSADGIKRYSQAPTEPPRWRTAVSWVRDQGERLNRLSFASKATSRS